MLNFIKEIPGIKEIQDVEDFNTILNNDLVEYFTVSEIILV